MSRLDSPFIGNGTVERLQGLYGEAELSQRTVTIRRGNELYSYNGDIMYAERDFNGDGRIDRYITDKYSQTEGGRDATSAHVLTENPDFTGDTFMDVQNDAIFADSNVNFQNLATEDMFSQSTEPTEETTPVENGNGGKINTDGYETRFGQNEQGNNNNNNILMMLLPLLISFLEKFLNK